MADVTPILDSPMRTATSREQKLRTACKDFVGMVVFAPMLRQARRSSLNCKFLDSSAQRIFQSQLDDVLLQQSSTGDQTGSFAQLGEALYRSLSLQRGAKGDLPSLEIKG